MKQIFSCKEISKSFGPTKALIDVSLRVDAGEIVGLIGENGSGKSTLTSIIAGAQKPDCGAMTVMGEKYRPRSMLDGQRNGIAMIVQEMGTLPNTSVASNVFVGNTKRFTRAGFLNRRTMLGEAKRILEEIGAGDIDPSISVNRLNFEDRKIIEIARAMYVNPSLLIIDESTTALAQKGRSIIYNLIKAMREKEKGVIFISHDLDELMTVCTRIVVLRDGRMVGSLDKQDMSIEAMRRMMIGREISDHYFRTDYERDNKITDVVLRGERLSSDNGIITNLDIELHRGEILGIGGLANSGMHELGKMLYGICKGDN